MTADKGVAKGAAKKRGLGRGLEALLGGKTGNGQALEAQPGDVLQTLPVDAMVPGKYQPRRTMDDAKLEELAASIKVQGVIQPIVVRERVGADGKGQRTFEIIAGERRWRASQRAGLREVPVVVRDVDDRTVVAIALIENIQREDLNPLEEAQALQRLIDEFDLTHAAAAETVGRSRAAVSNLLRLLELPEAVRALVREGAIEMGHARALLPLAEAMAIALAKQAAAEGWSVRQVEYRVQELSVGKLPTTPKKAAPKARTAQADIAALERELTDTLGSKVAVLNGRGNKGKLVIHFAFLDALDGVLVRLRRAP